MDFDYNEYEYYQNYSEYDNDIPRKKVIRVSSKHLGQLIGRSGSRIKEIKSKFSNDLEIRIKEGVASVKRGNFYRDEYDDDYDYGNDESEIELTANNVHTVEKCAKLIRLLIGEITAHGHLNRYSVSKNYQRLDSTHSARDRRKDKNQLSTYIPVEHFGLLIGKSGHRVKKIQEDFKVKIHLDKYSNSPRQDNVIVTSFESMRACRDAIEEISRFYRSILSTMPTETEKRVQEELKKNSETKKLNDTRSTGRFSIEITSHFATRHNNAYD